MDAEDFLNLEANFHQRIHGAHRLLKDNANLPPLDFPQLGSLDMEQFLAVQKDFAGVGALPPGQKPCDTHSSHGFPGAGLPHQAQDFALLNGEGYTGHGLPIPVIEFHMEITNLQHQETPPSRRCKPSPIRPAAKTIQTMKRPVPKAYQGLAASIPWASESM